jgi:hypothetical protein
MVIGISEHYDSFLSRYRTPTLLSVGIRDKFQRPAASLHGPTIEECTHSLHRKCGIGAFVAHIVDDAIPLCAALRRALMNPQSIDVNHGRLIFMHWSTTPQTMDRVTFIVPWTKSMSPYFKPNNWLFQKPVDTARSSNVASPYRGNEITG